MSVRDGCGVMATGHTHPVTQPVRVWIVSLGVMWSNGARHPRGFPPRKVDTEELETDT